MKKLYGFLLAAAAAAAVPAHATTYVGLDGIRLSADPPNSYDGIKKTGLGIGLKYGWRMNAYLGGEIGYEDAWTSNNGGSGYFFRNTLRSGTFDLFGYYPMGTTGWFQPFVTVGFGYSGVKGRQIYKWTEVTSASKTKSHTQITELFSETAPHARLGGGVEWTMGGNFAGRLTARYEPYGFKAVKNGLDLSLSLLIRV